MPPEIGDSQLLYLKAEPHRRLYVEVDAVEGAGASEEGLKRLRQFLERWCEKPDGITLTRSSTIARSEARGRSATALARQYMEGPPETDPTNRAAYLYVLLYDNRVNRNPLQSPRAAGESPAGHAVPARLGRPENPHVMLFPYPAMIYVDRSWLGGLLPHKYRCDSIVHETGHVLGLVRREDRILVLHCPSSMRCVMSSLSHNVKRDLTGWLHHGPASGSRFCEDCEAELRQHQSSPQSTNLYFMGPVLVRKMRSYAVLELPGACRLVIAPSLEAEIPRFIEEWRKWDEELSRPQGIWLSGSCTASEAQAREAFDAARHDPVPAVRALVGRLEEETLGKAALDSGKQEEAKQ